MVLRPRASFHVIRLMRGCCGWDMEFYSILINALSSLLCQYIGMLLSQWSIFNSFWEVYILVWACAWQNQQNNMCAQRRLRSAGHPPSLIRVFAVRSMDSQGPNVSSCGLRRLWSKCLGKTFFSAVWLPIIVLKTNNNFFSLNTKTTWSHLLKTAVLSIVSHTHENTNVFNAFEEIVLVFTSKSKCPLFISVSF